LLPWRRANSHHPNDGSAFAAPVSFSFSIYYCICHEDSTSTSLINTASSPGLANNLIGYVIGWTVGSRGDASDAPRLQGVQATLVNRVSSRHPLPEQFPTVEGIRGGQGDTMRTQDFFIKSQYFSICAVQYLVYFLLFLLIRTGWRKRTRATISFQVALLCSI
jgi:hypothetical protein